VNFSPSGDYFTSGGKDAVIMIWKSNLNQFEQELIDDMGGKTTAVSAASKQDEKESARPVQKAKRTTAQMSATPKCPGPVEQAHCHAKVEIKEEYYDPTYAPVADGVSGSGEEL
jgi:WD40 repeat protein